MGNELYEVGDSVLLTAGRPVPVPEQPSTHTCVIIA